MRDAEGSGIDYDYEDDDEDEEEEDDEDEGRPRGWRLVRRYESRKVASVVKLVGVGVPVSSL